MSRVGEAATRRDCVSRRHHYVPQSYLRAWSPDRKQVRVLDTQRGTDKLRGLRHTCVEENFYRVTDAAGQRHNQVEAMLAVIDEETARLLRQLRSWAPGDDLKFDDFMSLAVVMGLQRNRTPQMRRFIATVTEWSTRRAAQPAQELLTDTFVDLLFSSVHNAADQLSTRQLELWDDPESRLITSDQPILFSRSDSGEPPSMNTSQRVLWPISPTRLLVLSLEQMGQKVLHRVASHAEVDEVRATVIRSVESAIIALPGDRYLPSGKRMRRRPQVQFDCEPVHSRARTCRVRFAWAMVPTRWTGRANHCARCALTAARPSRPDNRPNRARYVNPPTSSWPEQMWHGSQGAAHAGREPGSD